MLKELIIVLKKHNIHYFVAIFIMLYLVAIVSSTNIVSIDDLPHADVVPLRDQARQAPHNFQ